MSSPENPKKTQPAWRHQPLQDRREVRGELRFSAAAAAFLVFAGIGKAHGTGHRHNARRIEGMDDELATAAGAFGRLGAALASKEADQGPCARQRQHLLHLEGSIMIVVETIGLHDGINPSCLAWVRTKRYRAMNRDAWMLACQ